MRSGENRNDTKLGFSYTGSSSTPISSGPDCQRFAGAKA
jgi:hypothetical protein